MLAFLFYCFLAYLLYNIIFKFVIPVYRATKQVKKGFKDMQDRMQQQTGQQNTYSNTTTKTSTSTVKTGDYIDFEEVKE
jgi:hypothetical protein